METIDFADGRRVSLPSPTDANSPLADAVPRCRRCAAVLVVAHLRCDDGALLPIYRCPICRHAATGESSSVSGVPRDRNGERLPPLTIDD